jgi:hypothetical protein
MERNSITCLGNEGIFINPSMEAKRYKVLPHLFFPDEPITTWVDANIAVKVDDERIEERFLGKADMAIFKHPFRNTVEEEFKILQVIERFKIPWLQSQLNGQEMAYKKEGFPIDSPLWECNFIIRRNTPSINRLMDAWWSEICRWQWRDQVSLPYVAWKYGQGINIKTIDEGDIRNHLDFEFVNHYV